MSSARRKFIYINIVALNMTYLGIKFHDILTRIPHSVAIPATGLGGIPHVAVTKVAVHRSMLYIGLYMLWVGPCYLSKYLLLFRHMMDNIVDN